MSFDGGELVEIENCPVKTSVHEIELGEKTVKNSIVISKYSNKIQILITAESGKVSVLYEASKSKGVQVQKFKKAYLDQKKLVKRNESISRIFFFFIFSIF